MKIEDLFEAKKKLKTLYCSRKLLNAKDVIEWAKAQGFKNVLEPKDMHVTIAYSKEKIDWSDMTDSFDHITSRKDGKKDDTKREVHAFGEDKKAIVLTFENADLHRRWEEFTEHFGASWDFPDYRPHVSITYDGLPEGLKLSDIKPYEGELYFGPETMDEVNTDWKSNVKEKKVNESLDGAITEGYSQSQLVSMAEPHENNIFDEEDPLGGAASEWKWRYVKDFPVATLVKAMGGAEEFMGVEMHDYHDDLFDGSKIKEPITFVERDGEIGLWDGWHRVSSSIETNRPTLPAIIGTNRQGAPVDEDFHIQDVGDIDHFYGVFKQSYEDSTGAAWSEDKLLSRARNWTFYGDEEGFVAVRVQGSGMKKLVAAAGNPRGVVKGLTELQASGGPIWGAVSAPLAMMAKKRGMIVPHLIPGGPFFIKVLAKTIPPSVFGGHEPVVTKDGGLVFSYEDVGETTKYIIGNKAYFAHMLELPHVIEQLKKVPGLERFLKMIGIG
jgi:hypothetical protein